MMAMWRMPTLLLQLLLGTLVSSSSSWVVGNPRSLTRGLRTQTAAVMPRVMPTIEADKPLGQVAEELDRANRFIKFLDSSPEPFHVVQTVKAQLLSAGFVELKERDRWAQTVEPGGKYFYIRNRSCIVAFAVGGAVGKTGEAHGFKVIGAHTDSPALKVKPKSKRGGSTSSVTQLNVETYGGGLWHTWFDRDLSLAGRVIVRNGDDDDDETTGGGTTTTFKQRLVHIQRPILKVPTLCIHLQSAKEREAFKVNKEDHLQPLLCGMVGKALEKGKGGGGSAATDGGEGEGQSAWAAGQETELLALLNEELGIESGSNEKVVDFELTLFDTQGGALGGAKREFVNGARLDNLASCFVAVEALVDYCSQVQSKGKENKEADKEQDSDGKDNRSLSSSLLDADGDVSVVALFDHEEVGSGSAAGAGSPLMRDAVERITQALLASRTSRISASSGTSTSSSISLSSASGGSGKAENGGHGREGDHHASLDKSLILSVDMAHAVHPNYANKHEKNHAPVMNGGPVLKSNSNQRYATNGVTGFLMRELARRAKVPLQEFAVRNDCPCGSTIGPVLSGNTGMRAVDLGMPQLSMHSCREMMGRADLTLAHRLFVVFFKDFRAVDDALIADD